MTRVMCGDAGCPLDDPHQHPTPAQQGYVAVELGVIRRPDSEVRWETCGTETWWEPKSGITVERIRAGTWQARRPAEPQPFASGFEILGDALRAGEVEAFEMAKRARRPGLVEQLIEMEERRAREGLEQSLLSMRDEIDITLSRLKRGEVPTRPSGLANNLTDVFHRIGVLATVATFAKLQQKEQEVAPAPPQQDTYHIKLTRVAAEGVAQALTEWCGDQTDPKRAWSQCGYIDAEVLVCRADAVELTARVLRGYSNSPRGSAGRRRAAKAAAQRLLNAHMEAQGPVTKEML